MQLTIKKRFEKGARWTTVIGYHFFKKTIKDQNMLNSPLFVHAYDIKEICSPLFSNSPVIYFEYAKFTSDGELSVFSTYPEFANLVI